jgi:hypothetical protein
MPGVLGIPSLIGGGLGLLSSLTGSNKPQTTSTSFDPASQNYITGMRGTAQNLASQPWGADPSVQTYMDQLKQMMQGGNLGMGILEGNDPSGLAKMMAPGQNMLNTIYNQQQGQGLNELNKQAALAGETGNNRRTVGAGSFLANMGATRAQGGLGLLQQMYQNAGLLSNLGMGATGQMGNLSEWLSNLPMMQAQGRMGILQQGLGPYGQTQTTPTANSNPFTSILGGLGIGAGLGGWGGTGSGIPSAPSGWQTGTLQAAQNPPNLGMGYAP